jgi:succinate dehydrogenase / fumarate reductase cytochrome b subunit
MPSLLKALKSQVGRKYITGITGVGLMIFIVEHLYGNLLLFADDQAYNLYTYELESMGWLLYIAEAGLALFFIYHAYLGISIYLNRKKARPAGYNKYQSKGGPSHQTISAKTMIFTGIVLLVFLVIHLNTFKFGSTEMVPVPGQPGQQMQDMKSLVMSTFQSPLYAFSYIFVMILLGFHLGHGFWSAFTSLTMKHNKYSAVIYSVGIIFAILMAVGFLFIPLYIYFTGGNGVLIS